MSIFVRYSGTELEMLEAIVACNASVITGTLFAICSALPRYAIAILLMPTDAFAYTEPLFSVKIETKPLALDLASDEGCWSQQKQ